MKPFIACIAAALAMAPIAAAAATITRFYDDFAAEVAGLPTPVAINNFSPLANWTFIGGTVDLFTQGGFGRLPCGSEGCLDLDGNSQGAARIHTIQTISFVPGATYDLTLGIAGKNGNADERLVFGIFSGPFMELSMPSGDNAARTVSMAPITPVFPFDAVLFIDMEGGDNQGILLDWVRLTETVPDGVVPLPATLPLALGGLAALSLVRMRRRT
jgi:hypothetical protein